MMLSQGGDSNQTESAKSKREDDLRELAEVVQAEIRRMTNAQVLEVRNVVCGPKRNARTLFPFFFCRRT